MHWFCCPIHPEECLREWLSVLIVLLVLYRGWVFVKGDAFVEIGHLVIL